VGLRRREADGQAVPKPIAKQSADRQVRKLDWGKSIRIHANVELSQHRFEPTVAMAVQVDGAAMLAVP
jgi:hypothetical protein